MPLSVLPVTVGPGNLNTLFPATESEVYPDAPSFTPSGTCAPPSPQGEGVFFLPPLAGD